MLTVLDEYSRECLAIDVARKLTSEDVLERLTDLFIRRGVPDYIRSDNGAEFTAHAVRDWLERVGVRTLYIEPGSPWENGYIESFNGKLQDELLEREIFDTLLEAKVLIERWRQEYNTIRPHSSLGYRPPAPEATQPWSSASATLQLQTTAEEQKQEAIALLDFLESHHFNAVILQVRPQADALYTTEKNVGLGVTHADCQAAILRK
jgi:hypothetical protein